MQDDGGGCDFRGGGDGVRGGLHHFKRPDTPALAVGAQGRHRFRRRRRRRLRGRRGREAVRRRNGAERSVLRAFGRLVRRLSRIAPHRVRAHQHGVRGADASALPRGAYGNGVSAVHGRGPRQGGRRGRAEDVRHAVGVGVRPLWRLRDEPRCGSLVAHLDGRHERRLQDLQACVPPHQRGVVHFWLVRVFDFGVQLDSAVVFRVHEHGDDLPAVLHRRVRAYAVAGDQDGRIERKPFHRGWSHAAY